MQIAGRVSFVVACLLITLSQSAQGSPSISYPVFLFNSPFQDNGNAQGVNFNSLLLTTDGNQNSSTFVIATQDLTQSFTAQFSFYIGSGSFGVHTTNGTGPGGIAFVIEGDSRGATALGGGGNQLGYGDGIANSGQAVQHSVALTYSTFGGTDQFQIFTNTTNANLNTQAASLATQTGSENLSNSSNQLTVNYEAPDISFPNGALTVLLNGNPIGLNNVALPASLSSLTGGNMGYFGFTASTGGATGTGPEIYVGSLVAGPPVPEPATGLLIGIAGIALLSRRRACPQTPSCA